MQDDFRLEIGEFCRESDLSLSFVKRSRHQGPIMKGKDNVARKGSSVKPNTNAPNQLDLAADRSLKLEQTCPRKLRAV